jgi:beta-lactamase class D
MTRRDLLTGTVSLAGASALAVAAGRRALPPVDFARHFRGLDGCFVYRVLGAAPSMRYRPERCALRLAPFSTFKVVNSLIGLETGVVADENARFKWDGTREPSMPAWNRDHTLDSAFEASALWCFQRLARKIGPERMRDWLHRLRYGNEDTSAGIDRFWLGTSLKVSADEQLSLIERLYRGTLPMSARSQRIVRQMMLVDQGPGGRLHGKTGTGGKRDPNGYANLGWFVGYLTGDHGCCVFATNIRAADGASGRRAREITRAILRDLRLLT